MSLQVYMVSFERGWWRSLAGRGSGRAESNPGDASRCLGLEDLRALKFEARGLGSIGSLTCMLSEILRV